MKNITSILLCIFLIFCMGSNALAAMDENRIKSLGILDNIPESESVSRLDFTKITMRLLGFSDEDMISGAYNFSDVDDTDSGYISFAVGMGIISQSEDGFFRPQDNITNYEAVKMLVCALGYGDFVDKYGDWPQNYVVLGAKLNITNGVIIKEGELAYSDMIVLLDNVLDLYFLEMNYQEQNSEYEQSSKTVYENLLSHKDMKKIVGIFEEGGKRSVIGADTEISDGKVRIDGREYSVNSDFSKYLGYCVEAYISEKNGGETIVSVAPFRDKNHVFAAEAEDSQILGTVFQYYDETDKQHIKNIDVNAAWVLNGRKIENPTDDQKTIYYGEYVLLDNNDDEKADIVFINEAQSFVVSRISSMTSTIYFDDDLTFRGSEALKLDYDDSNKTYIIENTEGEEMSFSSIEVGDAVTIYADANASFVKICVSNRTEEGKIKKISSENEVELNETNYKTALDENGHVQLKPDLETSAVYVIDALGRICGVAEELENAYKYAYVVKCGIDDEADEETMWFRLITGTEPKKHVTTTKGEEIISYYYQNDNMYMLRTEEKINVNDDRLSISELKRLNLEGQIIGYKLSGNGKINKLYTYELPGRIYNAKFNAKLCAYSSSTDGRGYLTNNKTTVICVPNVINAGDDWYVRLNVQDGSTTTAVYGVTAFPENALYSEAANAEPVDFLVISADMDSTQPIPVDDDDKVCIVGSISKVVSSIEKDDGEVVSSIEFLQENELKTKTVVPGSSAEEIAERLHKGDLIQYVEDSYGRIVTLKKIASIQGLGTDYKETIYGDYYGLASKIALDRYDYISNEMVDLITVNIGTGERNVKIFTDEPQPIYRYNRKSGNIYTGAAEDILSEEQVGSSEASKVYAHMSDNDVVALVIIED